MPIKTAGYRYTCIPKGYRAKLFKKETTNKKPIVYKGNNIIKDCKLNPMHRFALRFVDMMSPFMQKHNKIGKILLSINEKILKNADCLK